MKRKFALKAWLWGQIVYVNRQRLMALEQAGVCVLLLKKYIFTRQRVRE